LTYAAVEYDLANKSVCAMKGQVIADFTIDYRIKDEENTDYVSVCPWNLYFKDRFIEMNKTSAVY
jgi:hypothetical protein